MNKRYEALTAACERIRSSANRCWVRHVIDEAAENASFTIEVEKAAPAEQWDSLFVGSIGCLLAGGEYNANVVKFFAARGISY